MNGGIVSTDDARPNDRSPIRIAFCITDLDVGGAERMFVELITRLDRTRWEPRVFCLSAPGRLFGRLSEANIPVTCYGARSLRDIGVVWRLARELRQFQPRLLLTFLFHANLIGRFAGFLSRVPRVVCGIRVAERRSRWPLWFDRLTQCLVDHNVCVSRGVFDFSVRDGGLRPEKTSVIPNAVDFERFSSVKPVDRQTMGIAPDSRLILFVGRLDSQKAPISLVSVFERLHPRHPNWQLLLVGDGPLRGEIESFVAANRLSDSVRLAGWQADVAQIMKSADCLVLPSLWEGMPNSVLEAMASGLPVVVTRVEGTDELIQSGENGLLIEPGSDSELEQAIERILANSDLAARLALAAQQFVRSRFTFETMVENYERLFVQLIDGTPA